MGFLQPKPRSKRGQNFFPKVNPGPWDAHTKKCFRPMVTHLAHRKVPRSIGKETTRLEREHLDERSGEWYGLEEVWAFVCVGGGGGLIDP